ncbi:transcriptional regulator [Bacillus cereus]|nr:transcriptional regulator [Bacillus cereus]
MKELRKYSQFETIKEMDENVAKWLDAYKLKETEYVVLNKIVSYSCKFIGVSYLKGQTLADLVDLSKRTIQRAIKSLTEKGILTRVESFKPVKGGHSAWISVVNPFSRHTVLSYLEANEKPCEDEPEEELTSRDTINLKLNNSKDNTYVGTAKKDIGNVDTLSINNELDTTHLVASGVPMEFAISTLPYFDAPKVYKLWSKVQLATRKHAPDLVDTVEIAISSIKASVLASKVKRVRDFTGYFYGVLAQKLSTEQRKLKCNLFNFLQ